MEMISGQKKYANSIFLTEVRGAVLGSSFIRGFNVIFDVDRLQVGLAKADCSYDDANNRSPADRNGTNTISVKKKKKKTNFIYTIAPQ